MVARLRQSEHETRIAREEADFYYGKLLRIEEACVAGEQPSKLSEAVMGILREEEEAEEAAAASKAQVGAPTSMVPA